MQAPLFALGGALALVPAIAGGATACIGLDPCDSPRAILGTEGDDDLTGTDGDGIICGFGATTRSVRAPATTS